MPDLACYDRARGRLGHILSHKIINISIQLQYTSFNLPPYTMKIIQAIMSLSLSLLFAPIAWAGGDYKYDLRIDATVPSVDDGLTIDKCVEWRNDANDSNFTWYGLQVGLPEDATYDAYRNGFVQQYNSASQTILAYHNITTSESDLTISIKSFNNNDNDTRTYIVPVSNGNENNEFVWTWSMLGEVSCLDANGNIFPPVVPTLTISVIRFGNGGDNTATDGGCGGERKLSTGAIVGIIFACIVVLSIALVTIMLCIMRREERKESNVHDEENPLHEQLL